MLGLGRAPRRGESAWRARFGRRLRDEAGPLRGELLSIESLEERAKSLAAVFTLAREGRSGWEIGRASCRERV